MFLHYSVCGERGAGNEILACFLEVSIAFTNSEFDEITSLPWSDPEPACFHKGGFDFKIQESEIMIPNAITDSLLLENNILLGTFDSFPLKLLRIDFWSLESTPPYSPFKGTCF